MSSRRSSISFVESEQFTPRHNYNTRFSAKVKEKREPLEYEVDERKSKRDLTLLSDDSREFNLKNWNFVHRNHLSPAEVKLILPQAEMDRACRPMRSRYEGSWKYFAFGAVGLILYGIISHFQSDLKRIGKDIAHLKSKVRDIQDSRLDFEYKISKLDNAANDMKHSQAMIIEKLKGVIDEKIDILYADKTGRTDFALESAGGKIIQLSPGTENYGEQKSSIFGLSLCDGSHGPRAIIQPWISPGTCWAIKGTNGGVIIKLLASVKIDSVSLEHIPKRISPSGESNTAPKDFAAWGMSNPTDRGVPLGQWAYNVDGKPVQIFDVEKPSTTAFDYVEFKVLSNHGHPLYTCVYRFRVHGTLEQKQQY